MSISNLSTIKFFLLLLFLAALCNSMIIPFMGYFLVEGLKYEPWILSVYSVAAVGTTVLSNRAFANQIDNENNVFPLIGIAAFGSMFATLSIFVSPKLWTILTVGVIGFGLSSSAISTLFSLGSSLAKQNNIDRNRINAYMRATTSTAWMLGPAISFLVADRFNERSAFLTAFGMSLLWLCLWWWCLPHNLTAKKDVQNDTHSSGQPSTYGLKLAAAFVFCLSLAHSLTFTALPVFYVQEVGLPGYAPGVAFSMKTFIEVFAVFSTPAIIARFGMRKALMATTLLAIGTIQYLALVDSFPQMLIGAALEGLYYGLFASIGISYVQSNAIDRPARATAIYWNTLLVCGLLAGPAVGLIAQTFNFQLAVQIAVGFALCALLVLMYTSKEQYAHANEL